MTENIAIAWINLSYQAKNYWHNEEKLILNDLKGSVSFGTLTALMGPSGSGKTTLLKCINGRIKSGLDSNSKFYLNSRETIRSSFVEQEVKENLIMCLTAKQNMVYASKLKNSSVNDKINHEKNSMDLLSQLLINNCENTKVSQMSGGQQKRLSIAIELTQYNKPNLLCIDEPTTGLDSNAAEIVIHCLSHLSEIHKIAIIISIHQPNNNIVLMFDQIYVLAKQGICVYSGSPGHLRNHLRECHLSCASHQKPIEALLKYSSEDKTQSVTQLSMKTMDSMKNLEKYCKTQTTLYKNGIPFESKRFNIKDTYYLLMRTVLTDYVYQWKSLFLMFFIYLTIPITLTQLFSPNISEPNGCFDADNSSISCAQQLEEDSLLEQSYKFYYLTSNLLIIIKLTVTTVAFHSEVNHFLSEHRNKWYSTGVFFIVKNIVDLIPSLIQSTIVAMIAFYWSGLFSQSEKFWHFLSIYVLGFTASQSLAYFISIVFIRSEVIALECSIVIFAMSLILSNSANRLHFTPQIMQTMSTFSFLKYIYNPIIVIIYGLGRCLPTQISKPLISFDINNKILFESQISLILYIVFLRISSLLSLFLRTKNSELSLKIPFNMRIRSNTITKFLTTYVFTKTTKEEYVIQFKTHKRESSHLKNKYISIAWIDLTLTVSEFLGKNKKNILNALNGYFEFGTINALMGCSGAGKTTLLKYFNGRNGSNLSIDTKIYLSKFRRIRTTFISQDINNHLIRGLTAKESLIFASKLKNCCIKNVGHQLMVNEVMEELLISDISDTQTQDCSGGQKKRLVLGMELMSKNMPNLICIDEPTSGLDSNATDSVIKCLKYLSEKHDITIITSIHQPNNEVLMLFDKIYVLSKGGFCVYSGEPQNIGQHLTNSGLKFNEDEYPIEELIKLTSNDSQKNIKILSENVRQNELSLRCCAETKSSFNIISSNKKRFYFKDFYNLLKRDVLTIYRSKWKIYLLELIFYMILACSYLLFSRSDMIEPNGCVSFEEALQRCHKTEEQIKKEDLIIYNMWLQFSIISSALLVHIMSSCVKFLNQVPNVLLEQRNGWYSIGSFYWSNALIDMVPTILNNLVYSFIVNFYRRFDTFLIIFFLITLSSLSLQSLSHIIAIIFHKSTKTAIMVTVYLYIIQFVFSNWIIFTKELHYSIKLLTDLSHIKLSLESLFVYIYGFDVCSDSELSGILYKLDINDNTFFKNIYLLFIYLVILRAVAIIALIFRSNNIRGKRSVSHPLNDETISIHLF